MKLNGFNNDADSFEIETDDGNLIAVNDIIYSVSYKDEDDMSISIEHINTSIWDNVNDMFFDFIMDDSSIKELEQIISESYDWEEYISDMRNWHDEMNFEAHRERDE